MSPSTTPAYRPGTPTHASPAPGDPKKTYATGTVPRENINLLTSRRKLNGSHLARSPIPNHQPSIRPATRAPLFSPSRPLHTDMSSNTYRRSLYAGDPVQSSIPNPQSPIPNPQSSIHNRQSSIVNRQSSIVNPQSIHHPADTISALRLLFTSSAQHVMMQRGSRDRH